ncbi:MAG: methyltransferase type 12 [Phycisphaerales bacterium]|nr:methyltransferase type 12 [Phycisphaerales bacterium]
MPLPPLTPYDEIADAWDAARAVLRPKEAGYLDLLLAAAPAGSRVLDLGCGTGRPIAERVAALGYHVVGVDRSPALLARARRHVPAGKWVEADLLAADPPGPFAAAVCWDALFHLPRARHRAVVDKVYRLLAPGGRFMLSSGGSATDLPAFTDTMFGHTFFYDAFPVDETVRLVRDAGFEVLIAELADLPDGGRDKGKLAVIAAKPR